MQDYNRAIIIGNSSFGKATAQSIIPFEDNETNEDFLKITEQKFYRITGKSHQKNGLTPDIELPMLFDSFIPRESSKNYALEADEIVQKLYFKKFKSDFSDAIEKSKNRINTNSYFTSIDSINQIIKTNFNQDKKPLLLDFKSVFEDVHKLNDLYEETAKILKTKFSFQIQSTSEDIEKIKFNSFLQNETNEKIKQLENNGRVEEAIKILEHLIN
jgi:carboxyl-terminal processing protease